jgi:hypothetical protein
MNTVRQRHLPHWDVPGATFFVTACLAESIPAQGLLEIDRYRSKLAHAARPPEVSECDWIIRCWKSVFVESEKWLDLQPAVRYLADPALAKIVTDSLYFFAGERYDLLAYVVMPSHFHWVFRPYAPVEQTENLSSEVGQICNLSPDVGQICNLSSEVGQICNLSSEVGQICNLSSEVGQICNLSPDVGQICNLSSEITPVYSTPPDVQQSTPSAFSSPASHPSNDRLKICPTFRSPREKIMQSVKRYSARRCNERLGRTGTFWQDESHDHCVRDDEELLRIVRYIEENPVKAGLANSPDAWIFSSAHDRAQNNIQFPTPLQRRTD